jgi:uncharacterized RDD family membrane protein YckC
MELVNSELETQRVLATPGHRIGAIAVEWGLQIVTFGIGHFIWNLVMMAQGQSPGKQLLKVRVMSESSNRPATWGHMAIRNFLIPLTIVMPFLIPYYVWVFKGFTSNVSGIVLMGICLALYIGIMIVDLIWLFGEKRKRLIDYWAKTYVVNEANSKRS